MLHTLPWRSCVSIYIKLLIHTYAHNWLWSFLLGGNSSVEVGYTPAHRDYLVGWLRKLVNPLSFHTFFHMNTNAQTIMSSSRQLDLDHKKTSVEHRLHLSHYIELMRPYCNSCFPRPWLVILSLPLNITNPHLLLCGPLQFKNASPDSYHIFFSLLAFPYDITITQALPVPSAAFPPGLPHMIYVIRTIWSQDCYPLSRTSLTAFNHHNPSHSPVTLATDHAQTE